MDIGSLLQVVSTIAIGIIAFFLKGTLVDIKEGIKSNDLKIKAVEKTTNEKLERLEAKISDLKGDLPMVYVLRDDFIRTLNNVDERMKNVGEKLDRLLEKSK